jgi:hypothetical protein
MSYTEQLNEVLGGFCYSDALKAALKSFNKRDCVDAELLASLCRLRVDEVERECEVTA